METESEFCAVKCESSSNVMSVEEISSRETQSEFCAVKYESSKNVRVEEFDQICRCCLSAENKLSSIYDVQCGGKNFSQLLHNYTSVRVEKNDVLPKNVCCNCIRKVIDFDDFRKQCLLSENTFKKILQKGQVKNEGAVQKQKENNWPYEDAECKDDGFPDIVMESSDNDNNLINDKREVNKKSKIKTPVCRTCDETFETWRELKEHTRKENHLSQKKSVCKYCNKTILNFYLLQHYRRVHTNEKPFQCHICSACFSVKPDLIQHVKIHMGEKPHKCDVCGKAFIRMSGLKIHMRKHTGEKNYVCSYCGKSFGYNISYKCHLVKAHGIEPEDGKQISEISETKCDICQKVLSSKGALRRHQLTHGEKNLLCTFCGKGFFNKDDLQSHLKVHTKEKPHKCPNCPKSFSHIGNMKLHILTHTGEKPFVCEVCDRAFAQPGQVKSHMRTHSGERPYVCNYCGKSFALNGNLTIHVRMHTGETPHVCDVCKKGFYDSSSLKKHKCRIVDS